MRKSFHGLSALVRQGLNEDPLDGALYVFVNRRRTLLKALYFEVDGYCIWSKRLEARSVPSTLGQRRQTAAPT